MVHPMLENPTTFLEIVGHHAYFIPNRFYRQPDETNLLAIILPGLRYTCDMPLLYYASRLLGGHRADLLHVHTDYTSESYSTLLPEQRAEWLCADARGIVKAGLAQRNYSHLVLVGKSIGTLALACLLQQNDIPASIAGHTLTIWVTPLLHQPQVITTLANLRQPALIIASPADQTYNPAGLARIQQSAAPEVLLVENADHALEIPGDAAASTAILQRYTQAISTFLDQHLPTWPTDQGQ